LEKTGASGFQRTFTRVPVCTPHELAEADALIIGTPTRFGNMCGQMRQFFDATGGIWKAGALVGKVGSVFTSTATQHGGQESTILSVHTTLLHHGMIIAGLPYTFKEQSRIDEMTGCSPYGASTIAGNDGSRLPGETELAGKIRCRDSSKTGSIIFPVPPLPGFLFGSRPRPTIRFITPARLQTY
jgi:NAD(P)H dehydrogenase (quinone)